MSTNLEPISSALLYVDTRELQSVALIILGKLVPQLERLYSLQFAPFDSPIFDHPTLIQTRAGRLLPETAKHGVLEVMHNLSSIGDIIVQAQPGVPPMNLSSFFGKRKHGRDQVARWVSFCTSQLYPAVLRMLAGGAATVIQTKSKVALVSRQSSSKEIVDYRVMNFPVELLRLDDAFGKRKSRSCCGPTTKNAVDQCCITIADVCAFICIASFFGGMTDQHIELLPISLPHTLKFFVHFYENARLVDQWQHIARTCPMLEIVCDTGAKMTKVFKSSNRESNRVMNQVQSPVETNKTTTTQENYPKRARVAEPESKADTLSSHSLFNTAPTYLPASSIAPKNEFSALFEKYGPASTTKGTAVLPSLSVPRPESASQPEAYTGPLTEAAKLLNKLRPALPRSARLQQLPAENKSKEVVLRSSQTGMALDRTDYHLNVLGYEAIWNALPQAFDPMSKVGASLSSAEAQRQRYQMVNMLILLQSNLRPAATAPSSQIASQIPVLKPGDVVVEFITPSSKTMGLSLFLAFFMTDIKFIVRLLDPTRKYVLEDKVNSLGLVNVEVVLETPEKFRIGLALHACGDSTDELISQCMSNRAAFVVVPCCYSKMGLSSEGSLSLPRSSQYKNCVLDATQYRVLMTEADIPGIKSRECPSENRSDNFDSVNPAVAQECAIFINDDRNAYVEEHNYSSALVSFYPESCSRRNQVLLGLPNETFSHTTETGK